MPGCVTGSPIAVVGPVVESFGPPNHDTLPRSSLPLVPGAGTDATALVGGSPQLVALPPRMLARIATTRTLPTSSATLPPISAFVGPPAVLRCAGLADIACRSPLIAGEVAHDPGSSAPLDREDDTERRRYAIADRRSRHHASARLRGQLEVLQPRVAPAHGSRWLAHLAQTPAQVDRGAGYVLRSRLSIQDGQIGANELDRSASCGRALSGPERGHCRLLPDSAHDQ